MLILAGVSISAMVGEDGILTKAKAASIASRKASILDELNLELASYNIDAILKSPEQTTTMLGNLISKGLIDTVLSSSEEYVSEATSPMGIPQFDDTNNYTGYIDYAVKKEDYSIIISIDDSGIYKAEYGDVNISSGGSVAGGTTLVTDKAFTNNEGATAEEQGKFVIDNDASVMFVDEISGELSIQVKSGTHAKVYAFKDMTLTNSGIKRSAIDIEPGGTLSLYVSDGVTLYIESGIGATLPINYGNSAQGGHHAYSGIHVPLGARLNLYGSGKVIAIGGDASDGGAAVSGSGGGGGGGGAGAGIGGNGGNGGNTNAYNDGRDVRLVGSGTDGENGEDCGDVYIYDSLVIYAYGGGGGSGGIVNPVSGGSGSGGGGYPAAGIGGGGAGGGGGDHANGGGGFSAGIAEDANVGAQFFNGVNEPVPTINARWGNGGSYYNYHNYDGRAKEILPGSYGDAIGGYIGGQGGRLFQTQWTSGGDGGFAGKGGNIYISEKAKLYAFNGNAITDQNFDYLRDNYYEYNNLGIKTDNKLKYYKIEMKNTYFIPTIIYSQSGVLRSIQKATAYWGVKENYNYEYFKNLIGIDKINENVKNVDEIGSNSHATIDEDVIIRIEKHITPLTYINKITNSNQGIGSGAGYIEISNGTFTVDSSMN